MTVDRLASLLDRLRESQLLEPRQLEELSRLPEARNADPRALARQVLQRGWLTPYQVNQIANGRGKDLLLGAYRVLNRLGEGGMGQVFKAHHQAMNRVVAFKVIRKEKLANPEAVRRFYQEVQAAARLVHPNIVVAYDAGQVGDVHFLAMEYVEGSDLARAVKKAGPLPIAAACDYVRQAALGLQHAHERGLVHRDIKPANLLVAHAAGGPAPTAGGAKPKARAVVKILDMGLARWQGGAEQDRAVTQTGAVIGTPDYVAPEQALDSRAADIRADLYSLGCTFYYLLTGRPPFQGDTLAQVLLKHQMEKVPPLDTLRRDVPPGVQAVVYKLMAKRPQERYQTPAELVQALEPFCRDAGEGPPPAPLPDPAQDTADQDLFAFTLSDTDEKSKPRPAKAPAEDAAEEGAVITKKTPPSRKAAERKKLLLLAGIGGLMLAVGIAVALVLILSNKSTNQVAEQDTGKPQTEDPKDKPRTEDPKDKPRTEDPKDKPRTEDPKDKPRTEDPKNKPPPPPPAKSQLVRVDSAPGAAGEVHRVDGVPVLSVALAPDGRRVLAGCADGTLRLWDLESGKELRCFLGHTRPVSGVAFDRDGQLALSGSHDQSVRLWDVETGKELKRFDGHTALVSGVALSADGRRAFSAAGGIEIKDGKVVQKDGQPVYVDCTVRVWDTETGREVGRFEGHARPVVLAALSPDGRRVLSLCQGGEVCLWDVDPVQVVHRFTPPGATVACLAFSPDGRQALLGCRDKSIRLWDLGSNKEARRLVGHTGQIAGVAFSPDGRRALSAGSSITVKDGQLVPVDCTVRLWDLDKGEPLLAFEGHTHAVRGVTFMPDGRRAFSTSHDRTLRFWDLTVPDKRPIVKEKAAEPDKAAQDEALKMVKNLFKAEYAKVSGAKPGAQALLDLSAKLLQQAREVKDDPAVQFVLLKEARELAAQAGNCAAACGAIEEMARDYNVDAWGLKAAALGKVGQAAGTPEANRELTETCLAFIDEALAADQYDASFRVHKIAESAAPKTKDVALNLRVTTRKKELDAIKNDLDKANAAAETLKTKPDDPEANLVRGKFLCLTKGDWDKGLPLLAKGGDAKLKDLAARDLAKPAKPEAQAELGDSWWDLAQPERGPARAQLHGRAFHWYQQALPGLAGSAEKQATLEKRMHQVRDGFPELRLPYPVALVRTFNGHTAGVNSLAFSPDGRRALSASTRDKTIRLWEVTTGKELRKFEGFQDRVPLLFTPDVSKALVGGQDGVVYLLDLDNGRAAPFLKGQEGGAVRCMTYSADGRLLTGQDKLVRWWDAKTGRELSRAVVQVDPVRGMALASQGNLALVQSERLVVVWDLSKGKELRRLEGHTESLQTVVLSRDNRHALTGSFDSTVRLWEVGSGKELRRFGHGGGVTAVVFSPDGRRILSGGYDRLMRLWDADSGNSLHVYDGHTGGVLCVAFSPDGRLALSGSDDGTLRLWGVPEQKPAKPPPGR